MNSRPLSIEEQVASMRRDWPGFRVSHLSRRDGAARWTGDLKQFQVHRIEIRYRVDYAPEVRVLSPALIRIPENPEGSLPHVYDRDGDPKLCLYDPATDEWDETMHLSQTIVPWSADWLACYELWLMTGRWTGGGRHPTPRAAGVAS
ncbi:hypothetical protein [Mesorhizobium sp.]|uniref:hypothetical protein n=1 Tax=Mesorhizobium sp. TaxID=1871066 RepID=UPI000FEA2A1C|nr:hypothetical protein [Mesorhizobium sp.]RWI16680.1 MAG: hypothetical protein EOQ94_29025 [Mesorhizobium sp.]RWN07749.1 MAG: hypothetical protein EOR87_24145 [Mesorhizobium sp.]RWN12333.1 MAG: hypothetical protein EOR88_21805 [Mesorhizobium sp.]TIQ97441.1 MAG: hypothetical protein E5X36_12865 [Mesorhizobium sp.]